MRYPRYGMRLAAAVTALAGLAALVLSLVHIRADVAILLPEGNAGDLALLSRSLREGPANRSIMMALGTPDRAGQIANPGKLSHAFLQALEQTGRFDLVSNGDIRLDKAAIKPFFDHRYNLNPPLDAATFSAAGLRAALKQRLRELQGFSGSFLKNIIAADPTLRTLEVASLWKPPPSKTREGVWVDQNGARVLLVAQSKADGFDLAAQSATIGDIKQVTAKLEEKFGPLQLTLSGPSVIAVESRNSAEAESRRLLLISLPLVAGLLLLFLRSPMPLLLAFLPLGCGFVAATAAVAAALGDVQVTTLGFGTTLLGIAVDYPLHLLSRTRSGQEPVAAARQIWPALLIAAATTILAFAPLAVSSFPGLAQLGVFSVTGLVVATAVTRWILPHLMPSTGAVSGGQTYGWYYAYILGRAGRGRSLALIAGLAAVALLSFRPGPLWQDNLSALSPIPESLRKQDQALRRDLNVPDPRGLLTVDGRNDDEVLRKSERLLPLMQRLQATGKIESFDMAARYLPSKSTQERWMAGLPNEAALRENLTVALAGLPFKPGIFEPFLRAVAGARQAGAIGLAELTGSPLGARLAPLIIHTETGAKALILLRGLRNPAELRSVIGSSRIPGVRYLDLKESAETLMDGYRRETLRWVALGMVLAFGLVVVALRSVHGVVAVLVPVFLSVLITTAALAEVTGGLSIFHLLGLLMVAGLGIDYAVFLRQEATAPAAGTAPAADAAEALRAVTLCAATSFAVFALLATASIPILSQIGWTVAVGSALSWLLAIVFSAPHRELPS